VSGAIGLTVENDALAMVKKITMPGGPIPDLTFEYDHLDRETLRGRGSALWWTTWAGGIATTTTPDGDGVTRVVDGRGRTVKSSHAAGPDREFRQAGSAATAGQRAASADRGTGLVARTQGSDGCRCRSALGWIQVTGSR
jgi:hypothetical protein